MYAQPTANAVSRTTKYILCRYDRSKHSLGMTALISPLDGNSGALGSSGLYGEIHCPLSSMCGTLFAVASPPLPIVIYCCIV